MGGILDLIFPPRGAYAAAEEKLAEQQRLACTYESVPGNRERFVNTYFLNPYPVTLAGKAAAAADRIAAARETVASKGYGPPGTVTKAGEDYSVISGDKAAAEKTVSGSGYSINSVDEFRRNLNKIRKLGGDDAQFTRTKTGEPAAPVTVETPAVTSSNIKPLTIALAAGLATLYFTRNWKWTAVAAGGSFIAGKVLLR